MRPYIGVTGITQLHEMKTLENLFPPNTSYMGPVLMAGILVSRQTLRGESAHQPGRYPLAKDIQGLLGAPRSDLVRPFIHYHTSSTDKELLVEMMALAGHHARRKLAGLQLNVLWPSPQVLLEFHQRTGHEYEIILQMSRLAMYQDVIGRPIYYDVPANVQRIFDYGPSIDAVLFDLSGGHGELPTEEEIDLIRDYLERFAGRRYAVGIAGGLSSETLGTVASLFKECPRLSIDAESRLRDADDKLNISEAIRYIEKALELHGFSAVTQT